MTQNPPLSGLDLAVALPFMDDTRKEMISMLLGITPVGRGMTDEMKARMVIGCEDASGEFMIWQLSPVPLCALHHEAEQLLANGYIYADASWMTGIACPHCGNTGTFHTRYHLHDANGQFLSSQSRCFDVCFACLKVYEFMEVEYPKSKGAVTPCDEDCSQENDDESLSVTSHAQETTPMPDRSKAGA